MCKETKRKTKSKISKKNKKGVLTIDFMYSVFGLEENYMEDANPPRVGFFRKLVIKSQSIVMSAMCFINSLPL